MNTKLLAILLLTAALCAVSCRERYIEIDSMEKEMFLKETEEGIYKEGRYGIRIENLLIVRKDEETEFGTFYRFEPLTMVPYEKKLIDTDMLTDEELEQVNRYHRKVYYSLAPYLDAYSSEWLRLASSPMERKQVY